MRPAWGLSVICSSGASRTGYWLSNHGAWRVVNAPHPPRRGTSHPRHGLRLISAQIIIAVSSDDSVSETESVFGSRIMILHRVYDTCALRTSFCCGSRLEADFANCALASPS